MNYCKTCDYYTVLNPCPLCGQETQEYKSVNSTEISTRQVTAIQEDCCYICGTKRGKEIKIQKNTFLVDITLLGIIPVCTLCRPYTSNYKNIDIDHLTWSVLAHRLNQTEIFTIQCKNCNAPIQGIRKTKLFCSPRCRSTFWARKQHKGELP